ncbi:inner-membrane translocator [Treponema primitia ZAS-2]|uniref:Inner-membrane translocator n=1 Tax=Treponema primitia (strain ATCC BAA-887 / DSM 12427 / ZAS-2) TaxID=545694 RepID=F5YM72_TREPZ|nr:branched-chain amino acid ABC transporter permease [Treponema primitia]AEF85728.1 inner-membrane translocator [Treponema primitia ZAS-2]
MLTTFLQNVFNALQWGSFYSMIALGYCLVYGVLRLINFAHGDIFMTACYIAFFIATALLGAFSGGGVFVFALTLLLTMGATALVGITIERIAYRPLRMKGVNRLYVVITALMVGFILENGNLAFLGASARRFPDVIEKHIWQFGPVVLTNLKVLVILAAFAVFGLLQFIVQKTVLGMSMRAISYDKFAIPLMGIPVNRVITFTFALGSGLAAVAGILFGMSYPVLDPYMGMIIGWKAFIAAVVGGIGDIKGAFIGGFILGFIEIFITAVFPSSFKDLISFVILLIILVLKPTGFFGVARSTKI